MSEIKKLEVMPLEETVKWAKHNSWYVADLLARRGTEGENPLIPRAEYEMLSFFTTFLQHPWLYVWLGEKVGMEGIRETCSSGHREFGIKTITPCNIQWGCGIALFGRLFLVNAGLIGPNDYVDNLRIIYSFWRTVFEGYMRQGKPAVMDVGYVLQVLDQDVVEDLGEQVEPLDDPELRANVLRFNSLIQLLGFLDHYDCRLGLGDTGPYDLGDKLMLVRDCFVNEKSFPWTFVVGDLPFSYSLVLTYDKKKMMRDRKSGKMKMFSIYNTGTLFCDPPDYEEQALIGVAAYMRDEDYPRGKSTRIPLSELDAHSEKIEAAVERMYSYLAMKPWFDKILEGNWVYVAASLPYVRAHDLEEEAAEMGFWEMSLESMEYLLKGYTKAGEVQRKSMAGLGAPPPLLPGFRSRGTKSGRYAIA
jgi:hypothetical protein